MKKQKKYKGKGKMKSGFSDSDCGEDYMSSEGQGSEDDDGASRHEQTSKTI